MNAGPHWNPTSEPHGRRGTAPYHRGDIGNITVGTDGTGVLAVTAEDWNIGGSDASRNILNKALIVHANADDYVSQPSGNSGAHIGCGVVMDQ
jgi:Cu-Zn family superoxide dismutase